MNSPHCRLRFRNCDLSPWPWPWPRCSLTCSWEIIWVRNGFSMLICIDSILYRNYRNKECFLKLEVLFKWTDDSCFKDDFNPITDSSLSIIYNPVYHKFLSDSFLLSESQNLTFLCQFPFIHPPLSFSQSFVFSDSEGPKCLSYFACFITYWIRKSLLY